MERQTRQTESAAQLPAGWRWESYRGLEVAVPADWGYGSSTGQLADQWCVGGTREQPMVARPGPQTAAGCFGKPGEIDPGTLIEYAGLFLGFDAARRKPEGTQEQGDRTTVTIGGISVLVQAPTELRSRIVDTIRQADPDFNGAPATHRISEDPTLRPERPVDVSALTGVTAVVACKYGIETVWSRGPTGLLSSVRLAGGPASAAVDLIGAAPIGGGPDAPETCTPEVSDGDEVIVLVVDSDQGHSEIYLRYDGCDHHGFDDGVALRTLTAASVAPFVTGPNAVGSFSGVVFDSFVPGGPRAQ